MKVHRLVVAAGIAAMLVLVGACGGGNGNRKVGQVGDATRDTRPAAGSFVIGDIVRVNDQEVIIHGVQDPFEAGSRRPAEGSRFVTLDAEVRNRDEDPKVVSTFGQFELKDAEGETYVAVPIPGTDVVGGQIPPGGSRRGVVAFEVPQSAQDLEVVFKNLEFSTSATIDLG